jgi:hypothetical protein
VADDSSDVGTVDGRTVQTRFRGAGVNEAAVGAAERQDADRKKLAGAAAKTAGAAGVPKASDFGGDMAAFGAAMRKYREQQNASPQKAMVKDRLASQ